MACTTMPNGTQPGALVALPEGAEIQQSPQTTTIIDLATYTPPSPEPPAPRNTKIHQSANSNEVSAPIAPNHFAQRIHPFTKNEILGEWFMQYPEASPCSIRLEERQYARAFFVNDTACQFHPLQLLSWQISSATLELVGYGAQNIASLQQVSPEEWIGQSTDGLPIRLTRSHP
ncbi:AprI/Inh family metalloprotease inhibitor [Cochlodiniinecator piscidefendens]|uniref:AprI/Inh family metalloprotease inhibitor n=1 Tax=Cochlodiniinecator piscidefendens TaxID=2715756 RepID=UPI001407FCB6|nr:AprI/Inh family metalloprotease inhibitor [Cochlodiniinecator piscidefendens]